MLHMQLLALCQLFVVTLVLQIYRKRSKSNVDCIHTMKVLVDEDPLLEVEAQELFWVVE